MDKPAYQRPTVTEIGTLRDHTQGTTMSGVGGTTGRTTGGTTTGGTTTGGTTGGGLTGAVTGGIF